MAGSKSRRGGFPAMTLVEARQEDSEKDASVLKEISLAGMGRQLHRVVC